MAATAEWLARLTRLGAPTAAGVILRLSQLAILFVLSNVSAGSTRSELIATFGIVSSFAVISDSGAGTFLLTQRPSEINREVMIRCLSLHLAVSLAGASVAIGYCLTRLDDLRSLSDLVVVVALALTPAIESSVRVVRAPLLILGRDHHFASYDLALAASRVTIVVVALTTGDLLPVTFMPVTATVLLLVAWRSSRSLRRAHGARPQTRAILVFGANGAASTLYSQSPLLVGGLVLPATAVAALAICYRVIQPVELVPATLSQQATPRLRSGVLAPLPTYIGFILLGSVAMLTAWYAFPYIEKIFDTKVEPPTVFFVIAAAIPFKFGNYALAAYLFASDRVRYKLAATCVVGVIAVASSWVAANTSMSALAIVTLASEISLGLILIAPAIRSHQRLPQQVHDDELPRSGARSRS